MTLYSQQNNAVLSALEEGKVQGSIYIAQQYNWTIEELKDNWQNLFGFSQDTINYWVEYYKLEDKLRSGSD